tara:strand:- start:6808 stop:7044 length:237 start_codon:yes stop_codon:yes gene_type:complete
MKRKKDIKDLEEIRTIVDFCLDAGIESVSLPYPASKALKKELEDLTSISVRYSIESRRGGIEKLNSINYGGVEIYFKG